MAFPLSAVVFNPVAGPLPVEVSTGTDPSREGSSPSGTAGKVVVAIICI
jgi:hypothetical protein